MPNGKPRTRPTGGEDLSEEPECEIRVPSAAAASVITIVVFPPRMIVMLSQLEEASSSPIVIIIIVVPAAKIASIVSVEISFKPVAITITFTATSIIVVRKGQSRHCQAHYYRANHCFYRSIHFFQCQHVPSLFGTL